MAVHDFGLHDNRLQKVGKLLPLQRAACLHSIPSSVHGARRLSLQRHELKLVDDATGRRRSALRRLRHRPNTVRQSFDTDSWSNSFFSEATETLLIALRGSRVERRGRRWYSEFASANKRSYLRLMSPSQGLAENPQDSSL